MKQTVLVLALCVASLVSLSHSAFAAKRGGGKSGNSQRGSVRAPVHAQGNRRRVSGGAKNQHLRKNRFTNAAIRSAVLDLLVSKKLLRSRDAGVVHINRPKLLKGEVAPLRVEKGDYLAITSRDGAGIIKESRVVRTRVRGNLVDVVDRSEALRYIGLIRRNGLLVTVFEAKATRRSEFDPVETALVRVGGKFEKKNTLRVEVVDSNHPDLGSELEN